MLGPLKLKISVGLVAVLLAVTLGACSADNSVQADPSSDAAIVYLPENNLEIRSGEERLKFTVEIADDNETRQTGLMYRTTMPDDHGMLF